MLTVKPIITKVTVEGKEVKIFSNLAIAQKFNAHGRFSFEIPTDSLLASGAFLKNDGKNAALDYVGQKILIEWGESGGVKSRFNGIITNVSISIQNNLVPSLFVSGYSGSYALSNGPRTRSFFDKDPKSPQLTLEKVITQAVQGVMGPHCGLSTHLSNNPKLSYLVQYQESVFDFLNRLAIRYGEWFYLDDKTLYFGNPNKSNTHTLTFGPDFEALRYDLKTNPICMGVAGYNHQQGEKFKQSSSSKKFGDDGINKANTAQKNIFSAVTRNEFLPWQPYSSDEVKQQADYRSQLQIAQGLTIEGQSNKCDIKLGDQLSVKVKERDSEKSFIQCRVIAITHFLGDSSKETIYRNELRAIDKEATFIPVDLESMPPVYKAMPEFAEVVSTEDASGRVQVAFNWSDGDKELNKSFFMPCISPYSGGNESSNRGILFIPEKGDIVMVGYYQGDPSYPFVMGGVHNSKTASLKEGNKDNDLKTITTRSGHVIEFNDKKEAESITITDKNKNTVLMNKDGVKITANDAKNIVVMTKDGIKITDDNNKNSIELSSSGIVLKADKDLKITAKNITMEAQTAIEQKVSSSSVKVESASIEQKTGSSTVKLGAASIEQKSGAGSVEVGASGVDIKGPIIKMG